MKVSLRIQGVRNDHGYVRGLAFVSEQGFPEQVQKALAKAQLTASKGECLLQFDLKGLPKGQPAQVAFAVYHDEKKTGRIEKGFLGIPKCGITLSNWRGLGRPQFHKCSVTVRAGQELRLKMIYF